MSSGGRPCDHCGQPSLFGTCSECLARAKQEAARAEIAFGRLTNATWSTAALREIMEPLSSPAIVRLWGEYMKFGQMFGAGRHIVRVASTILQERHAEPELEPLPF